MEKKKVYLICFILVFIIFFVNIKSHAGLTCTNVKSDVSASISSEFAYCYNLRVSTSTLGKNSLDPHLMLNSDFAAAVYLGYSRYGAGGRVVNSSVLTTAKSINGNSSGIYSFGGNERTSSMRTDYNNATASNKANFTNLINFANTKYVEILPLDKNDPSNVGKAIFEIDSWNTSSIYIKDTDLSRISLMRKLFQWYMGNDNVCNGSSSTVAFRPVIWN